VAVSGGLDSVALLTLLHQLAVPLQIHLEAAHLDHSLRPESRDDARFVTELCAGLGVHLTQERLAVAAIARQRKSNLEETARDVRRDFLLKRLRCVAVIWSLLATTQMTSRKPSSCVFCAAVVPQDWLA